MELKVSEKGGKGNNKKIKKYLESFSLTRLLLFLVLRLVNVHTESS